MFQPKGPRFAKARRAFCSAPVLLAGGRAPHFQPLAVVVLEQMPQKPETVPEAAAAHAAPRPTRSQRGARCLRAEHRPTLRAYIVCAVGATDRSNTLNLQLGLTPMISLLAGILILVVPRMLNYIVAIYLIVVGLIGLFGATGGRLG